MAKCRRGALLKPLRRSGRPLGFGLFVAVMGLAATTPEARVALARSEGLNAGSYRPFVRFINLAGSPVMLATTNNSLKMGRPDTAAAFAVCLTAAAVTEDFFPTADGTSVVLARVVLQRHLARCDAVTGNFYWLVLDRLPARDFGARREVMYQVVPAHGMAPTPHCRQPWSCMPLRVSLPDVEAALGGLRLGPPSLTREG